MRLVFLVLVIGLGLAPGSWGQEADAPDEAQARTRLAEIAAKIQGERIRKLSEGRALTDEAFRLLARYPDRKTELEIRLEWSWMLSRRGKTGEGLEQAQASMKLAETLGDEVGRGVAEYRVALALWYGSRPDEAIEAGERSLRILEEAGHRGELARTLTLIGAIHRSVSDYDAALEVYFRSLEIAEIQSNPMAIARAQNNIGLVYWDLDQHQRAQSYLLPALEVYRASGKLRPFVTVLNNVGLIYCELEQPEKALALLEEGRAVHEKLTYPRGRAKLLGNLGFAYRLLEQDDKALVVFLESAALREKLGDRAGLARLMGNIAELHARADKIDLAAQYYRRGIEHAQAAKTRDEESFLSARLAEINEKRGEYREASDNRRRTLVLEDELDRTETAVKVAELESQFALAKKEREVAELRQHRAEQELLLSQQRARQAWLIAGGAVLLALVGGLFFVGRARARSLEVVRSNHQRLQETTARLAESERRYRSVFDDPTIPKLILDLDEATVFDVNAPAAELAGTVPKDLVGTEIEDLQPHWLAGVLGRLDFPGTQAVSLLEEWMDEGGKGRHAEVIASPVHLEGRACAVVSIHDVTRERQQEEERIRVDKLESLGLLAGGIAHDFNNALAAVLGLISVARHESEECDEILGDAELAIDQATQLTSQLLAFSKGGLPRREVQDIESLLRESVAFGLTGSRTSVDFAIDDDLWFASVDRGQFKQVISNLVINAVQAGGDEGQLEVSADNLACEAPLSGQLGPGDYVRIRIEDAAGGMTPEVFEKALDPYFTTKQRGSGLGLPTVFAIMARHGGGLDIENRPGEGTTVTLHFPAVREVRPLDENGTAGAPVPGEGRVLVLDDDVNVQRVYTTGLDRLGYSATIVADGREALRLWREARESGEPFDLAIMDLTIPGGMGGRATMSELRRLDPAALAIVASGYNHDPVLSDFEAAGFAASLPKPFTIEELGRSVSGVLSMRA